MRVHRRYPGVQLWRDRAAIAATVGVGALTTMRLERIMFDRQPAEIADLHFVRDGVRVVVPWVLIDAPMLLVRERDPLIFPAHLQGVVSAAVAEALVDLIAQRLEPRALRGGGAPEEIVRFDADPGFDTARAAGWFGAAPLAAVLPRVAPLLYACRFAEGARTLAYGPRSAEIGAFAGGVARMLHVAAPDPAAAAYYAVVAGETVPRYDAAIGAGAPPADVVGAVVRLDADAPGTPIPIVRPAPADLVAAFDLLDGPAAGSFVVSGAAEPPSRPVAPPFAGVPRGGSGGIVAIGLRPGAVAGGAADLDEARALAGVLESEGFTVAFVETRDDLEELAPDLVHLIGVRPGGWVAPLAAWAQRARRPLAVHAHAFPWTGESYWGTLVARHCFSYSPDERSIGDFAQMIARRTIAVDGVLASDGYAPPEEGTAETLAVLREAGVVFVQSEAERAALADLRPGKPTLVIAPLLAGPAAPVAIGARAGAQPFVLVHAPLEPASNLLAAARALTSVAVPAVFAGAVADAAYAELLRAYLPPGARLLSEPDPATLAALDGAAAVALDPAWIGRGVARTYRAAAAGCVPVLGRDRWTDLDLPERWRPDIADPIEIARAVGDAWDAANRRVPEIAALTSAARTALGGARHTLLKGYAQLVASI